MEQLEEVGLGQISNGYIKCIVDKHGKFGSFVHHKESIHKLAVHEINVNTPFRNDHGSPAITVTDYKADLSFARNSTELNAAINDIHYLSDSTVAIVAAQCIADGRLSELENFPGFLPNLMLSPERKPCGQAAIVEIHGERYYLKYGSHALTGSVGNKHGMMYQMEPDQIVHENEQREPLLQVLASPRPRDKTQPTLKNIPVSVLYVRRPHRMSRATGGNTQARTLDDNDSIESLSNALESGMNSNLQVDMRFVINQSVASALELDSDSDSDIAPRKRRRLNAYSSPVPTQSTDYVQSETTSRYLRSNEDLELWHATTANATEASSNAVSATDDVAHNADNPSQDPLRLEGLLKLSKTLEDYYKRAYLHHERICNRLADQVSKKDNEILELESKLNQAQNDVDANQTERNNFYAELQKVKKEMQECEVLLEEHKAESGAKYSKILSLESDIEERAKREDKMAQQITNLERRSARDDELLELRQNYIQKLTEWNKSSQEKLSTAREELRAAIADRRSKEDRIFELETLVTQLRHQTRHMES